MLHGFCPCRLSSTIRLDLPNEVGQGLVMAGAAESFAVYRAGYAALPDQGVESEGIWSQAQYEAALADPRSIRLELRNGVAIPLLVPIDQLPHLNAQYYAGLTNDSPTPPIYYYSQVAAFFGRASTEALQGVRASMQRLAAERALVVYDYPALETDNRTVEQFLTRLGDVACRRLIGDDGPRHYHFVSEADLLVRPLNLQALFAQHLGRGYFATDRVQAIGSLSPDDVTDVLGYYASSHEALSASDPVLAGFTEQELREILADTRYTKFVYRAADSGRILNMSIVGSLDDCPWFNRAYFEQHFPEAYTAGRIICGIGTITNPYLPRHYAPSVLTLGLVARLVALAGGKSVFTFATDEVSRDYSPQLAQRAMRASGMAVHFRLVSEQVFRAVQLEPRPEVPPAPSTSLIARWVRGRA